MGEVESWVFRRVPVALSILWTVVQLSASCPQYCVCQNSTNIITNITSVVCAQGNLTTVPKDLPHEVTSLNLSGNRIVLLGVSFYEEVNMSFNLQQSLNTSVFDHLYNLQTVDLSQNAISTIQPNVFEALGLLKELNLSSNNLTDLYSDMLSGLTTMEKLNLGHNNIASIENDTFMYLGQLRVLDLSHNDLSELLAFSFLGLQTLEKLNLQHNKLRYIEKGTFLSLRCLQVLDLSHNSLTAIDTLTYFSMPNLISLSFEGNKLQEVTLTFTGTNEKLQELSLDDNQFPNISIPVFRGLDKMEELSLSRMPSLTNVAFDAFHGLPSLKHLNLSHNPCLTLVHSHLFDQLPKLASIDLSHNNLSSLSVLTFHNNHNLQTAKLDGNHFTCNCGLAWLAQYVTNHSTVFSRDLHCLSDGKRIHLTKATTLHEMCKEIPQVNTTELLYFAIGSPARITCEFEPDPDSVVIWTTPRQQILTYHAFHPEVISHMLSKEDTLLNSSYHASHYWHNSSTYQASLSSYKDRIVLLNDGSLYIDYVLRLDNGPYKCLVMNANYNSSDVILIRLDYSVLFNVKVMSIIVGSGCAVSLLLLNIIYSIVRAIARRLVNKRRREAIRKLLENLDLYKTTQFARLRENYSGQLNRIRDQYHNQFHRLSDNYNSQLKRVRRGCTYQVVRIRDNYTTQVGRLRNYSSHQIEQIRERYNNQLLKMRDYGSLQMVRLHEKYKLQQQHVIKLLETMNLDNCKTVIETECLRTESMIFDVDILKDTEDSSLPPLSGSDSEYITASSSENSSQDSLRMSPCLDDDDFERHLNTQEFNSHLPDVEEPQVVSAQLSSLQDHANVSFVIDMNTEEGDNVRESIV